MTNYSPGDDPLRGPGMSNDVNPQDRVHQAFMEYCVEHAGEVITNTQLGWFDAGWRTGYAEGINSLGENGPPVTMSKGDDSETYRTQMKDAGRGELLR